MHGPHQVAQKSTSTTPSFSLTVLPKFADVNLTVAWAPDSEPSPVEVFADEDIGVVGVGGASHPESAAAKVIAEAVAKKGFNLFFRVIGGVH